MYQDIIDSTKKECENALDYLKKELAALRTGRASRALVENLRVDYYNTKTPLFQLASISTPEPNLITIQPYDKDSIKDIEKAISNSNLGITPDVKGDIIRVVIPPLSEERRKELVSVLNQKLEEVKISIRNHREQAWKKIKEQEAEGKITEDEKYRAKDELDKLAREYDEKINDIGRKKEKEIMTV